MAPTQGPIFKILNYPSSAKRWNVLNIGGSPHPGRHRRWTSPMEFSWNGHGDSMEIPWKSHGHPMEIPWNFQARSLPAPWQAPALDGSTGALGGLRLPQAAWQCPPGSRPGIGPPPPPDAREFIGLRGGPCQNPCEFHGISMGFPWNFNGVSVDFPWNSHGISSPELRSGALPSS